MDLQKYDLTKFVYSIVVDDIKFIKGQQWKITNYGLLAFAAIYSSVSVLKIIHANSNDCKSYCLILIIAIMLIFTIAFLCIWLLIQTNSELKLARERLENCKQELRDDKELGNYFIKFFKPQSIEEKAKFTEKLMIMFYFVLVIGAVITISLVCSALLKNNI